MPDLDVLSGALECKCTSCGVTFAQIEMELATTRGKGYNWTPVYTAER